MHHNNFVGSRVLCSPSARFVVQKGYLSCAKVLFVTIPCIYEFSETNIFEILLLSYLLISIKINLFFRLPMMVHTHNIRSYISIKFQEFSGENLNIYLLLCPMENSKTSIVLKRSDHDYFFWGGGVHLGISRSCWGHLVHCKVS